MLKPLMRGLVIASLCCGVGGCRRKQHGPEPGPFEQAGRTADEALEKGRKEADEALEKGRKGADEALEKAGEKVKSAERKVGEKTEQVGKAIKDEAAKARGKPDAAPDASKRGRP